MISSPLQPGTIRLARSNALNYPPLSFATLANARKLCTTTGSWRGTLSKTHYLPHRGPTESSRQSRGEHETYKLGNRPGERFPRKQKIAATKHRFTGQKSAPVMLLYSSRKEEQLLFEQKAPRHVGDGAPAWNGVADNASLSLRFPLLS